LRSTRELATNVFFKLLPAPFEKLSRFLVVLVAAPLLGASAFGTYQYALTASLLAMTVFDLGLGTFTTRALARRDAGAPRVVAAGYRLRAWTALPYAAVVAFLALVAVPEERVVLVVLGGATLLGSVVDYGSAALRGLEDFRSEASVNVLRAILATAAALGALLAFRTLPALALGSLAGAVASAWVSLWFVRRRVGKEADLGGAPLALQVRELAPLGLAGLLSVLYFRCDVVLLRFLTSPTEVGYYGAAYRIFEATTVVPAALSAVVFPRLAQRWSAGQSEREGTRIVVWTGALGVAAAAGLSVASERIVAVVFGEAFAPAAASLRVLGLAAPFLFLNFGLTSILFARGGESAYVRAVAVMLVLNVATNALLIPRLGGVGAAWATLGTEAVLAACCAYAARRSRSRSDGFSMRT
jgi:O-antigen/teichoic acid export membrane protein